ncbi:MAG: hypothetical protein KF802_15210 [Bdellovibrionaceae bacterium]|nr:hypothetical protein [Pseudobdellovibrionaceae bacterium]
MRSLIFTSLFLLTAGAAPAAVILSQTVGAVDEEIFTSRQVALAGLMDRFMANVKDPGAPTFLKSERGRRELSGLLLESAVALEAESFSVTSTDPGELNALIGRTEKYLGGRADWRKLEFSGNEIRKMAERKLMAKNLIRMKSESMRAMISDPEAASYFDQNRAKFGNLPFDSFKENIKNFLAQQQLEDRLRSWFDILRRKHKVREFTDGSVSSSTGMGEKPGP